MSYWLLSYWLLVIELLVIELLVISYWLLVICLVGRENLFLLGPPGTAKSALVRELANLLQGKTFEYLLTRFTEPNELFGPFDIRRLREGDLVTNTEGMLPEHSRGNWYGNFEYHSWPNVFEEEPNCRFLLNQYASEDIIIWLDETAHLSMKKLEKNKYFDSQLMVGNTHFVSKLDDSYGAILLHDGNVAMWVDRDDRLTVASLDKVGMLLWSRPYTFSPLFSQSSPVQVAEMFHKHKQFFSYKANILFSIAPDTYLTRELNLEENLIAKMAMPTESPNFGMAIITYDSGCLQIQSDFERQPVRDVDFFCKRPQSDRFEIYQ